MASTREQIAKMVAKAARRHGETLDDLVSYRTFALCQGTSLTFEEVAQEIKKGVCWAMSYDWARFQVYDYRVNQARFVKIRTKTVQLQKELNRKDVAGAVTLEKFAREEGFAIARVAGGARPAHSVGMKTPDAAVIEAIMKAIDADPKADRAGVRMFGFDCADGGHEIALRLREPFRLFDPNYGQFDLPSLDLLKTLLVRILTMTYLDKLSNWDMHAVTRAKPARQKVIDGVVSIPKHVGGSPGPVHKGKTEGDLDAEVDGMLGSIFDE